MSKPVITTPEQIELEQKRRDLEEMRGALAEAEGRLTTEKVRVEQFSKRYFERLGELFKRRSELHAEIAEIHARREPSPKTRRQAEQAKVRFEETSTAVEIARHTPDARESDELRRLYRLIAKRIHPDLATTDADRIRRHEAMKQAQLPSTVRARPHVVITVHGIRTFGHWQERLEALLRERDPHIQVLHYKFGFFSLFMFLIRFLWPIKVISFSRELEQRLSVIRAARIDFVAHSFGTYLVAMALRKLSHRKVCPAIDTVILAGTVLPRRFNWAQIPVQRVVNDCGVYDWAVIAGRWLVPFCGDAGYAGFNGFHSQGRRTRWFRFGHSGFFSEAFLRHEWLPLLFGQREILAHDDRSALPRLHRVIVSFAIAATLVKTIAAILIIGVATESVYRVRSEAKADSAAAAASAALGNDPTHSLRLALGAFRSRPTTAAYSALLNAYYAAPRYATVYRGQRPLSLVRFVPGSHTLVTCDVDGHCDFVGPKQPINLTRECVLAVHKYAGHIGFLLTRQNSVRLVSADGRDVATYRDAKASVQVGDFSVDNSVVTGGSGGKICFWSPNANPRCWDAHAPYAVTSVRFSPDGTLIASTSSDNTVRLWDRNGNEQNHFTGSGEPRFDTSETGGYVFALGANGRETETYHRESIQSVVVAERGRHGFLSAEFSHNGEVILAGATDGSLWAWAFQRGPAQPLMISKDWVCDISFSRGGEMFVTASLDGIARLWRADGTPITLLRGHNRGVLSADISDDDQLVATAGEDGTVRLWDLRRGAQRLGATPLGLGDLTKFINDDNILTGSKTGKRHQFNLPGVAGMYLTESQLRLVTAAGAEKLIITDQPLDIIDFAATPDLKTYAAAVRFQNSALLMQIDGRDQRLDAKQWNVSRVAFSADGHLLATAGEDGLVVLWDPQNGRKLKSLPKRGVPVRVLEFSPSGELAVGYADGHVTIYHDTAPSITYQAQQQLSSIAFSKDGENVACASFDGTILIRSIRHGSSRTITVGSPVSECQISPDGSLVLTRSAGGIRLWAVGSGFEVFEINIEDTVAAAFTRKGDALLTALKDGNVLKWDIDGNRIANASDEQLSHS